MRYFRDNNHNHHTLTSGGSLETINSAQIPTGNQLSQIKDAKNNIIITQLI